MTVPNEIKEAFKTIEKANLKPNVIICTACGCVIDKNTKRSELCEHFLELQKYNDFV